MKPSYLILFLLTICYGCNEGQKSTQANPQPFYTNTENAWQELNLYDSIKSIATYKELYINAQSTGDKKPLLKESFTELGATKKTVYFDMGTESGHFLIDYDSQGRPVKTISVNGFDSEKTVTTMETEYDTIQNSSKGTLFINDSLTGSYWIKYDKRGNISELISPKKEDTVVNTYTYMYNETDQLLVSKEIQDDEELVVDTYTYDEKGQLVRYSNKSAYSLEISTETKWENNRITQQTEYMVLPDLQKSINEVRHYDDKFNTIKSENYENGELHHELNYQYTFDDRGNWIKRLVSMKEHFANSKKFIPIYIESREIQYWR